MADTIKDINRRSMARRNAQLLETLKNNKYINVRTLSEANFIVHFLPTFSGKVDVKKEVLDAWAKIAGELDRPVDLTDGAGKVVVRVPPLLSTDAYRPIMGKRVGIQHEMDMATKGSNPRGDNYIYYALSQRLQTMFSQGDKSEHEKEWVEFLKRYSIEVNDKKSSGPATDELEYEY